MDTTDEVAVEDHRYFRARLDHLESRHPAFLLALLESGALTEHLRAIVVRAMSAKGNLVFSQQIPEDQADELVMNQIVADSQEPMDLLMDPRSRGKLRWLLPAYKTAMRHLPRTYLSQSETIE